MHALRPIHLLLLVLAVAGGLQAFAPATAEASQPNLVFIIADDCTHHDLGCYGGQAHTPHIDKLSQQGIWMTRCFQAAPMCSPTRSNIYTGLYPVKSGAYPSHTFVKPGVKSVPHYLRPLGYKVALSGKRHISPPENFPFDYLDRNDIDWDNVESWLGERTEANEPFCLFLCSHEPHGPWNKGDASRYPPDEVKLPPYYVDCPELREAFSRYLAEITVFDQQVGRVVEMLDDRQVADDTLLMVVSEQGNGFPFAKWTLYDAGIQSAMVARWPGKIAPGTTSDAMVEYVDVLPTFIDVAGGQVPEKLDGKSMRDVLTGRADRLKDHVFAIQTSRGIFAGPDHYGRRSVRSTQFKLIHNLDPEARFYNGIAKTDYFREWERRAAAGDEHVQQLVERYYSPPEYELYDVVSDPFELNNLAGQPQHASVQQELETRLRDWMRQQGDEGQATEMAAIDRMLAGNAQVKEARGKTDRPRRRRRSADE